jgi:hypothetical protein
VVDDGGVKGWGLLVSVAGCHLAALALLDALSAEFQDGFFGVLSVVPLGKKPRSDRFFLAQHTQLSI